MTANKGGRHMRFVDGVNVTYIRKDEKGNLSKILSEISKVNTRLQINFINSPYYGTYRIEFYEPTDNDRIPSLKLIGFISVDEPIEWLMSQDNQSELNLEEVLHIVDTEALEIDENDPVVIVSVDQSLIYSILNRSLTEDMTLPQLVTATLKRFFKSYFDEEFLEEEFDVEIHPELTDFFI